MSIKQGTDKRGHPYKIVDGKHVSTGSTSAQGRSASSTNTLHDQISDYLAGAIGKTRTPERMKEAIGHVLHSQFGIWFKISARTSAGRSARWYAAAKLLELMRGGEDKVTDEDKKHLGTEKDFDPHTFLNHFVPDLQEPPGDTGPDDSSGDEAIVAVVHRYGLNADQLEHVLSKSLESVRT